ncbi:MAG: TonB-dependent receptor [Ignavibacteriae bacterium]|nr:TonB-dependent receptor [Ignavibacteriota bacterium]
MSVLLFLRTRISLALQLLLTTFLLTAVSEAQIAGKISGVVRDQQTREPLVGVNITILGTRMGATTDLEGSFFILNIPAGKYELQASLVGYGKVVQRDVIVNSNKTTVADFGLTATTIEQEAIVVEATRPDVQREKTSTSEVIRGEDAQLLAGMRDVNDVIGLAADVTDGHFRGGRENEEYYTLQGLGIVNPLDATAAFRPIMSAVEEVEVITSGFGAQYGNAQSGVINITMKEGKTDRWRAKVESRVRAPGLKYFGPSIYDLNANPYLQKLSDPNFWLHGDSTTGGKSIFGWTTTDLGGDTTAMIQVAQALWKSATERDLNKNYWRNQIDYSFEGAIGGPLDDGVTMFLAGRTEETNPIVPTEKPNKQYQIMGNVLFDFGSGAALRLSSSYQYQYDNVLGSGTGFYQWVWDRVLGISYRQRTNLQAGARFTKAVSPQTFYELKLNTLRTTNHLGTSPWYDEITDAVRNMETGTAIITRTMSFMSYEAMTGKTFFNLANNLSNFQDEKTTTASLDASFTSQVTKSHLLNGGIQGNYYFLDVNTIGSIASKGSITQKNFKANPYEVGLYIQDKMEFEGMIANVGLRWDLWDSNNEYYQDQFDPFVVRDSSGNPTLQHDPNLATKVKTKPIGRLQPRVGVSFPVSTTTVFHLNYGSFMQRPSFQYVIGATQKFPPGISPVTVNSLGNPRLQPQVTNSYDIGVMQGLGDGFTLDVSGYYKDIKDQIEQAVFDDEKSGTSYFSYFNRDYADVRGFRISLVKRRSAFSGSLNYQFGVATGKSASASNAPVLVKRDNDGNVSTDAVSKVPIKDVLLNFDRTHNLIINLAYSTPEEFGPEIMDAFPFENVVVSVNAFARSGRPFTSTTNLLDVNGKRTPAEYNTNLKVAKRIAKFFGTSATFYMEVFNLFNNKIYNYNYIFNNANKVDLNTNLANYETYPIDDTEHGILYWDDQNFSSAYGVNHSFLLYENSPRAFYFGITLEF